MRINVFSKTRTCISILSMVTLLMLSASGCVVESKLTVSLASPGNGSTVVSTTPTLIWSSNSVNAYYRLLIATDSNFQQGVLDASNIRDVQYTVPPGTLQNGTVYYWKIIAHQGNEMSQWTPAWSFRTPGNQDSKTGNIKVSATLDGKPWTGDINYAINGPFSDTDNSVPWNFNGIPVGHYTITYNYGGPANASLGNISPQPSLDLGAGETLQFVLNFYSKSSASSIKVNATLNGSPWSGNVNYTIDGPFKDAEYSVPQTLGNLPGGTYTLLYKSGGPTGAVLSSISPSPTQTLPSGANISYTLNFVTTPSTSLSVSAVYNGVSWTGSALYSICGPSSCSNYTTVPIQLTSIPAGNYTIEYKGGGPAGASLTAITPAQTIYVSSGSSAGFVLNYSAQPQTGNVVITATLDGAPWSGIINYAVSGPFQMNDNQVPRTYNSVPAGTYTVSYLGGGPANAMLAGITPAPTQTLSGARTISFNFRFISQPSTGTIRVRAMLDGKSWVTALGSGSISYTITGPSSDSGDTMPGEFGNMPAGRYTLVYNSGGPIGATLTSITPSPTQILQGGSSLTYTLNFTSQARGFITVNATLDGKPWSGQIGYVVQGPYIESGDSVPRQFGNAPEGTYSVQFTTGGPAHAAFERVVPSSQMLQAGGNISFTIVFRTIPMPGPVPQPAPAPGPLPGPLK